MPDVSIEKLGRLAYFCKIGFGLSLLHREVVNFIKLDVGVQENRKIKRKNKRRADAFLSTGRLKGTVGEACSVMLCFPYIAKMKNPFLNSY